MQYHYLIAGLPDLLPEQEEPPFAAATFRQTLREHLTPADHQQVDWLMRPADHRNLWAVLNHQADTHWDNQGVYPRELLEQAHRDDDDLLPGYLRDFARAFRAGEPLLPGLGWENQLTWLGYDHLLAHAPPFPRAWFAFERDLRNWLVATNAQRHGLDPTGQLLGHYDLTDTLATHRGRDFGLAGEYPELAALPAQPLLDRELAIDRLRWQWIDTHNTFEYFGLPVLLGYLLKLHILERWARLQPAAGERRLLALLAELTHKT